MKILLVEDEDRSVRQALELIAGIAPASVVEVAGSRDGAFASMDGSGFDLILCDLRIPPFAGSADVDERHGLAVHAEARRSCPGTPIIFLTAFATKRNTRQQQSSGGTEDIFGIEGYPMVQVIEKDDLDDLEELLCKIQQALDVLDESCDVDSEDIYDEMFLRAVRTYAKQINMPHAKVQAMPGGLSGAPLGRVTFTSPESGRANIFMKVVPHNKAVEETRRFNEFVPPRLQLGHYAHSLPPMLAGLRGQGALISSLADECVSLFQLLRDDPGMAAEAVKTLREAVRPWANDSAPNPVNLGELRRRKIQDDALTSAGLNLSTFANEEARCIDMKTSICHGDLHGENLLVTHDGRPVLIDFGDLGVNVAPCDPVTLELSIVFHKGGPARGSAWARTASWDSWADLDSFASSSPYEAFIRECRAWAMELDTIDSVNGMAYAHAIRQFKYDDVDPHIARAVASSALRAR